jgi:hypothetical protein
MRIELLEVPPPPTSVLRVKSSLSVHSRDIERYHVCLDCTRACLTLDGLIRAWNVDSVARYRRSISVLSVPEVRRVAGREVEMAMIGDPDGNGIELIRRTRTEDTGSELTFAFEWQDDDVAAIQGSEKSDRDIL